MNTKYRERLQEIFGDRISFNKTERRLYSHDIAEVPSIIKPLIGNTIPDVVVQPETEKLLSKL